MKKIGLSLAALSLLSFSSTTFSAIGFSGMEQINDDSYLIVVDTKAHKDKERIGILKTREDNNTQYTSVEISDWKHPEGRSSDLENLCKVPNSENEFLLGESSYWKGQFGRIFHIKLNGDKAEVLHINQLPQYQLSSKDDKGDNFEGMECFARHGKTYVILGERGGSKAYPDGLLRIGIMDNNKNISWDMFKDNPVKVTAPGNWLDTKAKRSISDLHIDNEGNIWSVATEDAGNDGPFRSVIFKAATITDNPDMPVQAISNTTANWTLDGFKVEALSGPSAVVPASFMSIATEDENHPGVWRPLFAPIQ